MKPSMFLATSALAAVISTSLSAEASCDATLMHGSIAQLSATHATVDTSVLINATPAEVWATLTEFEAMAGWSSGTLQGMTGDIEDGGSVTITFIFGTTEDGEPNIMTIPHTLIYDEDIAMQRSPADP